MVYHTAAPFDHEEAAVERKRVFSFPDKTGIGQFKQSEFQQTVIVPQQGISALVVPVIHFNHSGLPV